jgi:hypothetical protein
MPHAHDAPAAEPNRPRRERSTRYPGAPLAEAVKVCESIEGLGVDGLTAPEIAAALGYRNIKTNTFSARLSAARQFGLLELTGDGYALTPLARELLHPVDPADLPRLYRQALLKPPLYAELAERLTGKKAPDGPILGNLLYHHHQIIAAAKQAAAEAFLDSAKFAGALGDDGVFRPEGSSAPVKPAPASRPAPAASAPAAQLAGDAATASGVKPTSSDVRLDLHLWDADAGKTIRLRAPRAISRASYERFLDAFRLMVKVNDNDRGEGAV